MAVKATVTIDDQIMVEARQMLSRRPHNTPDRSVK